MKKTTIIASLLGCLTLIAGCSGNDDPEPAKNGAKMRQITIAEVENRAAAATRATLTTADDKLSAKWTAGDGLAYCNLSLLMFDRMSGNAPTSGPLTAQSTAAVSLFTGGVLCGAGDKLAVVYPAKDFGWHGEEAQYTLALSGQDGTLATLAKNFHCVYGVATVNSVTETTANATMVKMKSLLTVCKFTFKNRADNSDIAVKTFSINYENDGTDGLAGTYPHTAAVVCNETQSDVHAVGVAADAPLLLEGLGEAQTVFVALLPTSGPRTFNFTVTDGSGNTYTGTAKATLAEGEYVEATGLKLTKTN